MVLTLASESKDGDLDVSYEPTTQKNNRIENLVQSSKIPVNLTPVSIFNPPLLPQALSAEDGFPLPPFRHPISPCRRNGHGREELYLLLIWSFP